MADNPSDSGRRSKRSTMTTTMTSAYTTTANPDDGDEGDAEVWETFDRNFHQVQSVLDRNRVLIQQVNENHQSRIADNMVKNVALIQEINGNISKVVSLYSDLSSNFSSAYLQKTKDRDGDTS